MLSDTDEAPRSAPVFKTKRKMAAGKRRVREAALSDDDEESLNAGPVKGLLFDVKPSVSPEPLRVARWARYSALSENNTVEGGGESPVLSENKAYTTMDFPATFLLRESSYFRDTPMERISLDKEYADTYGNMLDEEEKRHANVNAIDFSEEDDGNDIVDHEHMGPPRDLGDMYDLEVSINDDAIGGQKMLEIPDQADVLKELTDKVAALGVNINLQEQKLALLKQSLAQLQAKKQDVLRSL